MITLKCLNIGTPKSINFPFGTNGKLIDLGVPILLTHIRVEGVRHRYCFYNPVSICGVSLEEFSGLAVL